MEINKIKLSYPIIIHNDVARIDEKNRKMRNLIIFLVYKLTDKGLDSIELSYNEVAIISGLKKDIHPYGVTKFLDKFKFEIENNLNVNYLLNINGYISLFDIIEYGSDSKTLIVRMNQNINYLNNNLKANYCTLNYFELLKSDDVTQRLLLDLITKRYLGEATYSYSEMIKLLHLSVKINITNFRKVYLSRAIDFLKDDFKNITVIEIGRGKNRRFMINWDKTSQINRKKNEIINKNVNKEHTKNPIYSDLV